MSEHIEIETEISDDGQTMYVHINRRLLDDAVETYDSAGEMEEGSPIAQALAVVPGIVRLSISATEIIVSREPGTPWHLIEGDIAAVLKDFFL